MNKATLIKAIEEKQSMLCIGLDPDLEKLPKSFSKDAEGILKFNLEIIEATAPYAVAYKPNFAFYECLGSEGWDVLAETFKAIPNGCFTIADAKRGDIGNTATKYAEAVFTQLGADSITIAPYMGRDSVAPFLAFPEKWGIVLGLTSNSGSADFQHTPTPEGPLYQKVMRVASTWGSAENLMFVVGATQATYFKHIREFLPDHFLLVPGIGAQGGDLEAVCAYGINQDGGLLINVGRAIAFASSDDDFAQAAKKAAHQYQEIMAKALIAYR